MECCILFPQALLEVIALMAIVNMYPSNSHNGNILERIILIRLIEPQDT